MLLIESASEIWSNTAKTPRGAERELAFQLSFERSAEIHSGEGDRARVSSAQAPRKAQLFCAISIPALLIFLNKLKEQA
ncbi:hypothetical protein D9754_11805 [Planomicrobium sp. Y74]|nr:hypothetical protein D9754_11805 [Planomicrobium sp. Y74]